MVRIGRELLYRRTGGRREGERIGYSGYGYGGLGVGRYSLCEGKVEFEINKHKCAISFGSAQILCFKLTS